jgi:hypothetical protein
MASMLRAAWMAFAFAAVVMMLLLVSMTAAAAAAAAMTYRTFVVTIPTALATSMMSY